ncbi:MAG: hypothetical protein HYZ53_22255 [Planctomycetes bacterium]|nr:hypothetical protein [Planctomycetota bacterium]
MRFRLLPRCGVRRWVASLLLLLLLPWAAPARADQLKLRDGRTIDGRIVREDADALKVELIRGAVLIARTDVVEIVRQKGVVDFLEEKLLELSPAQPRKYLDSGKWCVEVAKYEEMGQRLIQLSMALDPRCYAEGSLYLGDMAVRRKERRAAAEYFASALLAEPGNPQAQARYEQMKDAVREIRQGADERLVAGMEALRKGSFEEAAQALAVGEASLLRPVCETLLGMPLADVVAYCQSRVPCRACRGTRQVDCGGCKGRGANDCQVCIGQGFRVWKSVNGVETKDCRACNGWGNVLCDRCKPYRVMVPPEPNSAEAPGGQSPAQPPVQPAGQPVAPPAGSAPPVSPGAGVPPVGGGKGPVRLEANIPGDAYLRKCSRVQGGKLSCRSCPATEPKSVPAPAANQLAACCDYLARMRQGALTQTEQTRGRMLRVGAPGRTREAAELLATPVWWNKKWVSVADRSAADSSFQARATDEEQDRAAIRKAALPLQSGAAAPDAFEASLRKTFSLGAVSDAAAQPVQVTDFSIGPRAKEDESTGPCVAEDPGSSCLRPFLVQVAQRFATRRVVLETVDRDALPVSAELNLSSLLATPGLSVRIYYTVVDVREDVAPSGERDVATRHFVVKVPLVDFVDAGGKIVASSR